MFYLLMHRNKLECIPLPLTSTPVLYFLSLLFEGSLVMGSTRVGSRLACKLKTGLELAGSDEQSSLLRRRLIKGFGSLFSFLFTL
jgi:hypothetical protein